MKRFNNIDVKAKVEANALRRKNTVKQIAKEEAEKNRIKEQNIEANQEILNNNKKVLSQRDIRNATENIAVDGNADYVKQSSMNTTFNVSDTNVDVNTIVDEFNNNPTSNGFVDVSTLSKKTSRTAHDGMVNVRESKQPFPDNVDTSTIVEIKKDPLTNVDVEVDIKSKIEPNTKVEPNTKLVIKLNSGFINPNQLDKTDGVIEYKHNKEDNTVTVMVDTKNKDAIRKSLTKVMQRNSSIYNENVTLKRKFANELFAKMLPHVRAKLPNNMFSRVNSLLYPNTVKLARSSQNANISSVDIGTHQLKVSTEYSYKYDNLKQEYVKINGTSKDFDAIVYDTYAGGIKSNDPIITKAIKITDDIMDKIQQINLDNNMIPVTIDNKSEAITGSLIKLLSEVDVDVLLDVTMTGNFVPANHNRLLKLSNIVKSNPHDSKIVLDALLEDNGFIKNSVYRDLTPDMVKSLKSSGLLVDPEIDIHLPNKYEKDSFLNQYNEGIEELTKGAESYAVKQIRRLENKINILKRETNNSGNAVRINKLLGDIDTLKTRDYKKYAISSRSHIINKESNSNNLSSDTNYYGSEVDISNSLKDRYLEIDTSVMDIAFTQKNIPRYVKDILPKVNIQADFYKKFGFYGVKSGQDLANMMKSNLDDRLAEPSTSSAEAKKLTTQYKESLFVVKELVGAGVYENNLFPESVTRIIINANNLKSLGTIPLTYTSDFAMLSSIMSVKQASNLVYKAYTDANFKEHIKDTRGLYNLMEASVAHMLNAKSDFAKNKGSTIAENALNKTADVTGQLADFKLNTIFRMSSVTGLFKTLASVKLDSDVVYIGRALAEGKKLEGDTLHNYERLKARGIKDSYYKAVIDNDNISTLSVGKDKDTVFASGYNSVADTTISGNFDMAINAIVQETLNTKQFGTTPQFFASNPMGKLLSPFVSYLGAFLKNSVYKMLDEPNKQEYSKMVTLMGAGMITYLAKASIDEDIKLEDLTPMDLFYGSIAESGYLAPIDIANVFSSLVGTNITNILPNALGVTSAYPVKQYGVSNAYISAVQNIGRTALDGVTLNGSGFANGVASGLGIEGAYFIKGFFALSGAFNE